MIDSCRRWQRSFRTLLLLGAMLGVGCTKSEGVLRARGDVHNLGRSIHPSAYSYFISALHDEAEGNRTRAESLYLSTLKEDPQSGAAWAGLIRTGCHRSQDYIDDVLNSARMAADRPALALVDYANCLIAPEHAPLGEEFDRLEAAATACREAMVLEPLLTPATRTLARALRALGKMSEAKQVERAYELYSRVSLQTESSCAECVSLEAVDQALFDGDIARAKDLSAGRLTSGEFSARVLSAGAAGEARVWAEAVLINDPFDPDARIVFALTQPNGRHDSPALLLLDERSPSRLAAVLYLVRLRGSHPDLAERLFQTLTPSNTDEPDPLLQWWEAQLESPTRKPIAQP